MESLNRAPFCYITTLKATNANRKYCIDNKNKFKTYGENSWGLTAGY